jgi:predicted phage-related endonuclease
MQVHQLTQGSPQWLAHRATCWNASDAPAMMGCSPYKTRTELLDEMSRGFAAEVDAATQRLFDDGHRFEALARPLGEKVIGEDLSPLSGSIDAGLSRPLAASFDGITFMGDDVWEHKSLNDDIRAVLPSSGTGNANALPLHLRVQMEQQVAVSAAKRVLFTASKWDGDRLVEARHGWYTPDPELRAQIIGGWQQFERDLAAHVPAAAAVKPMGAKPETLPALHIEVTGAVTASNLEPFKAHALQVFAGINRDLQTDQDFADAEATVKWCASVEEKLAAAKQHALSQTETIDALFRAIDDISAEARRVRLDLDKLVKARKDAIRAEIVSHAQQQLREHVAALNAALPRALVAQPAADFAAAIKGKRTVESLRDACAVTLANARAEADTQAGRFRANLATMGEHAHLFPDFATVGSKPAEDFAALLQLRQHQAAEAARLKAEREAAEKAEADRLAAETAAKTVAVPAPAAAVAPPAPVVTQSAPVATPAPAVVSLADEAATLTLGEVCTRLGFTVTADFLAGLGFEAKREGAAKRYRPSQFPGICDAISAHVLLQRSRHATAGRELAAA